MPYKKDFIYFFVLGRAALKAENLKFQALLANLKDFLGKEDL